MASRLIVRDDGARRLWTEAQERCAVCGRPQHLFAWPGGETHHIIGGVGRSDEPCNWLYVCNRDHRCYHGERERVNGELIPKLTLCNLLWAKMRSSPNEYDGIRLARLLGRSLPALEETPEFYLAEYRRFTETVS